MAKECTVEVDAGVCKMKTTIHAVQDETTCMVHVDIKSDCHNVLKMSWRFPEINPYTEIECPICETETYKHASEHLPHAACPVPCAILKAVEVASDLGIKRDVTINIRRRRLRVCKLYIGFAYGAIFYYNIMRDFFI